MTTHASALKHYAEAADVAGQVLTDGEEAIYEDMWGNRIKILKVGGLLIKEILPNRRFDA